MSRKKSRDSTLVADITVKMLLIRFLQEYRVELSNYVIDQVPLMKSAQDSNSPILIEGANALMLDLDFGTYPYVTSVSTSSAEFPISRLIKEVQHWPRRCLHWPCSQPNEGKVDYWCCEGIYNQSRRRAISH